MTEQWIAQRYRVYKGTGYDGAGLRGVDALWVHRRNVRKRKKGRERLQSQL